MLKSNRDCSGKMDMKFDIGTMNNEYMTAAMPAESYMGGCGEALPGVVCPPVYECPQERVVNRTITHEVPHICPCNTRIINHHVYRHSFTPCYSCCEENVVSNVYDGCCGRY
ncbi:MAG: hypothetical protein IJN03_03315 [Bacilli bacterium]|nr:hypothetical protein [Bacilli bacterium]